MVITATASNMSAPNGHHLPSFYYGNGSLPRNASTRLASSHRRSVNVPRATMSLARSSSVRNSWAARPLASQQQQQANGLVQVSNLDELPTHQLNSTSDLYSHRPPVDSVSLCQSQGLGQHQQLDERAKYNTMTPLEAKKLGKFMNIRQPQRTASVHNKPRPPPLILGNGSSSVVEPVNINDISTASTNNNNHQTHITSNSSTLNKSQLSSSTTKVFQSHLNRLGRFLRYIPMRRSLADSQCSNGKNGTADSSKQSSGQTLAESVSQLCLDRSLSPPFFPPPPTELKSMSYMESNMDYSNYDDFTRSRNQQQQINKVSAPQRNSQHNDTLFHHSDEHDGASDSSWQLTSLPVSLGRDLATVFEEKSPINNYPGPQRQPINNERYFIRPPANFDECRTDKSGELDIRRSGDPRTSSSHSLTSITTADSVLDYHQQLTSSLKYPCANKSPFEQSGLWTSTGLPPKVHIYETTTKTSSCDISDDSAGTNGLNNCDQLKSLETDKSSNDFGRPGANGCLEADADTTIISNTSTLQGHSQTELDYRSRCSELEQQVNYLRDKLVSKDKELTDLQLKLWSADYLIAKLKSDKGKLEKDNAHLKEVVAEAASSQRATM